MKSMLVLFFLVLSMPTISQEPNQSIDELRYSGLEKFYVHKDSVRMDVDLGVCLDISTTLRSAKSKQQYGFKSQEKRISDMYPGLDFSSYANNYDLVIGILNGGSPIGSTKYVGEIYFNTKNGKYYHPICVSFNYQYIIEVLTVEQVQEFLSTEYRAIMIHGQIKEEEVSRILNQ